MIFDQRGDGSSEGNPDARCGVLAYAGDEVVRLTEKVIALPIRLLLAGEGSGAAQRY